MKILRKWMISKSFGIVHDMAFLKNSKCDIVTCCFPNCCKSPSLLLEVWKRSHHHHVHKISPLKLKSSSGHKCTDFRHWWVVLDCKRAKKFHKKQGGERRRSTKARGQRLGILMPDSLQSVLTMNALWTCISWYQRGVIKKCKHCLSQKSFKAVLIDFLTRNFA